MSASGTSRHLAAAQQFGRIWSEADINHRAGFTRSRARSLWKFLAVPTAGSGSRLMGPITHCPLDPDAGAPDGDCRRWPPRHFTDDIFVEVPALGQSGHFLSKYAVEQWVKDTIIPQVLLSVPRAEDD